MEDIKLSVDKITPQGNRMLISVYEGRKMTEGGLEIAETAGLATPVLGKVIKAGPGVVYPAGTIVMFRRYAVDEIKADASEETKFYFIEESEVIATYESEEVKS